MSDFYGLHKYALLCLLFGVFQGTAVFWYNLFSSGEGDYSTRHAACPVLVGNKWGELLLEVSWRSAPGLGS